MTGAANPPTADFTGNPTVTLPPPGIASSPRAEQGITPDVFFPLPPGHIYIYGQPHGNPATTQSGLERVQDPVEHPSGDHAVATGSLAATPIDQSGPEPSDSVGPIEHPVDHRS